MIWRPPSWKKISSGFGGVFKTIKIFNYPKFKKGKFLIKIKKRQHGGSDHQGKSFHPQKKQKNHGSHSIGGNGNQVRFFYKEIST